MWHFMGLRHTLTPPTYFQGVKTPNPTPKSYAPESSSITLRSWYAMNTAVNDKFYFTLVHSPQVNTISTRPIDADFHRFLSFRID